MADKLGSAYVEIYARMDKLNAQLAEARGAVDTFAAHAQTRMGRMSIGAGGGAFLGAVGGLMLAKNFLMDAIPKGADLNETLSKIGITFGKSTESVLANADDMAAKFGTVKNVSLDAAANFGLIGQAAGMTEEASAQLANQFVRLADDASSFFNVGFDVAADKLKSGLTGQIRPLREFGVLLSINAVKAQAAAMGFQAVNGQYSEQEKVLARVELITKGLQKAQGDHARTMDSYVNQIRKVNGEWENFKASTGAGAASTAASALGGRDVMRSVIQKHGVMGALGLSVASLFGSESATNEITNAATQDIVGREAYMSKPVRGHHAGIETGGAFLKRTGDPNAYGEFFDPQFGHDIQSDRGFGAFGPLGNIGMMMNNQALTEHLDKKISQKQADFDAWGGGHVMDPLSFARAAQEKISTPVDTTAKEQLDELKAIREILANNDGAPGMGMILKGRE